jgi:hypothetical protein
MTVCIAARANDGSIFCAADRMVTVGDIEMESPVPKIHTLTASIVVMPSDEDAALHTEILLATQTAIVEKINTQPKTWVVPVIDVVELYIQARDRIRAKILERTFLVPLGLTHESFHSKMSTFKQRLVDRVSEDLISHKLPGLSVIIAGIDPSGAHIYEVHDGESGCFDAIGYAAIGVGARHARAHFMISGQSYYTSVAETLWATYLAKKRSEVAPGVGETTDIAMLGPRIGANVLFEPPLTTKLESVYKQTKKREEKARKTAASEMVKYVEKLGKNPTQISSQAGQETAPKAISGDTKGTGEPAKK